MIDFHCHLDLYPDPQAVARECTARDLYVLSVTNTPSAFRGTAALAPASSRIRTALGLHPQIASERKRELSLLRELLANVKYVGEIGLDGTPEYRASWADQTHVFSEILQMCADAGGRVLSVHSRGAASAVLAELETHRNAGTAVLHWFSGTQRELAHASDMGCWFSVGPAMLAGAKGRGLVARMPRDRVLPESDGPFARIDGRAALPWDVEVALRALAELWEMPLPELRKQMLSNLRRLVV
jgi:TatD DNase family protein